MPDTLRLPPAVAVDPALSRADCLSNYAELIRVYERKCNALLEAVDVVCDELVDNSKIPELASANVQSGPSRDFDDEDIARSSDDAADLGAGILSNAADGDGGDSAALSRDVKRCFVEAMERLQSTSVPKKRRGNLPKEATAAFKKWFDDHENHPYPTDEEKRILANDTGTAISQITNWFINHRKRVWKPSRAHDGGTNGPLSFDGTQNPG